MQTRKLGPFDVSAIGLGAMPLSMGANTQPGEEQAIATIHAALDAGITYIDTADVYAPSWDTMGHNERLVAKALKSYGDTAGVIVGTKGGITRSKGGEWGRNGTPTYLRSALEASMRALDVDVIDLYQWHRPDRARNYADVIATFAQFLDEGLVKAVGISNANVEEIKIASDVFGPGRLASVQNEFSPRFRSSQAELELTGQRGATFLPWSPLGGTGQAKEAGSKFAAFAEVAAEIGVSVYQVVLAWHLAQGEHVIPIPGASRPESIIDSAKAIDVQLSDEQLAKLNEPR